MSIKFQQIGICASVMEKVFQKEKELGQKLNLIWFANSRGKREYLYGKFGSGKNEVIVTLGERVNKEVVVI